MRGRRVLEASLDRKASAQEPRRLPPLKKGARVRAAHDGGFAFDLRDVCSSRFPAKSKIPRPALGAVRPLFQRGQQLGLR